MQTLTTSDTQLALDLPPDRKTCGRCHREKLRSEFGINRDRKCGLQSYCKLCVAEDKLIRDSNRERKQRVKEAFAKITPAHASIILQSITTAPRIQHKLLREASAALNAIVSHRAMQR